MPQPLSYHAFADCRSFLGDSQLLQCASRTCRSWLAGCWDCTSSGKAGAFPSNAREQLPYIVFFLGALLTCFGFRLLPCRARQFATGLGSVADDAGVRGAGCSAALAERVDLELGLRSLWPLLALGVVTVLYWYGTERAGRATSFRTRPTRPGRSSSIVVVLLAFPARRYTPGRQLLAWAAPGTDSRKSIRNLRSAGLSSAGRGIVSGHTIKHVLAAGAVFAIVRQLRMREPVSARIADRMNASPESCRENSPEWPSQTAKKLGAHLRGLVGKAIEDYRMIADGDRRHGVPVRRQGFIHAAGRAAVVAAVRAHRLRARRRESRSEAAGFPGRGAARLPAGAWACRST